MSDFLAFVECAGCGELFPVRKKKALNRAKWCSERCRKAQYSTPCVDCGAPTDGSNGHGSGASMRCGSCGSVYTGALARERSLPHRLQIEALWAEGKTARQICAELGVRGHQSAAARWRARGYDLPYRRGPEQLANIRAGNDGFAAARARKLAA